MGDSISVIQAHSHLLPPKSQPLFSPRSFHSSHQPSSPYSLSLSSLSCSESYLHNSASKFLHFNLFISVAEGYWLKQSSMSPYAGFLLRISLFLKFMLHFLNSNLTHLFMFLSAGFCRIYVPWISFVALTPWTTHSQTVFQLKLFPFSNSCSHWRFFFNVI